MTDFQILLALFALGVLSTIITQLLRRTTTVELWFKENWLGLCAGAVSALALFLIGAGDDVDMGSVMARTWAFGIGSGTMFVVGGNVRGKASIERRAGLRVASQQHDDKIHGE